MVSVVELGDNFEVLWVSPALTSLRFVIRPVPSKTPTDIEAILLNATSVYIKWQAPDNNSINGNANQRPRDQFAY